MKESEEERLIEAIKPCRRCGHVNMAHKFLAKQADTMCCIDASLKENGKYVTCECKEFAPKDNLEFLQWQHDKKAKRDKKR